MSDSRHNERNPIGILDIGSNSVRCVVFEKPYINIRPAFNEKIQCGLGRDLSTTGKLNEEGKILALEAIKGFKLLTNAMNLHKLHAIGTAALRDAQDGPEFQKTIEDVIGLPLQLLSGEQEAYYSASGVLSAFPQAEGVVGDLGGGSLELACIQDGLISKTLSLPLGVLRIKNHPDKVTFIEEGLAQIPESFKHRRDFYVVGGSWRAVARAHMKSTGQGVQRLSGYYIPSDQFLSFSRLLSQQSPEALMTDYQVEARRADLLPSATLLLSALVRELAIRSIIVSNSGLRDGVLLDLLEKEAKERKAASGS